MKSMKQMKKTSIVITLRRILYITYSWTHVIDFGPVPDEVEVGPSNGELFGKVPDVMENVSSVQLPHLLGWKNRLQIDWSDMFSFING